MATNWTDEQRQVINLRGCNILVSAAAGSGKTAVLVARILAMLTDEKHPVDIDRLLIVTFTNAAAGEMRDRIRSAIEQEIERLEQAQESGNRLLEHLQRQVSLLGNAQITTIHSFCQYVIRNYFHTIDLDPGLRIADEGEQKLLQNEVMERLLEEKYAQGTERFLHMTECFAPGSDDRALAEQMLSLYGFSMSFPWPQKWLKSCADIYREASAETLDKAKWTGSLMELSTEILEEVRIQIAQAETVCAMEGGPFMYLDAVREDARFVDKLLKAGTYSGRSAAFLNDAGWARLTAKKSATVSEEKKQQVKDLRDSYKKTVKELQEEFFYDAPETLARQMRGCAPVMEEMIDTVCEFSEMYAQEKQKKNLMDFNDLEHFALRILIKEENGEQMPTPVAEELSEHYHEIMIDEYQDSNFVQELLLRSISGMHRGVHNMFMVGDVKQSIYRFRLARPELFMEKYRSYSLREGKDRRIDLHKNFRSRAQVLDGVNFLFEQMMEEHLGNVQYDDAAALYAGAQFPPGDDAAFRDTEVLMLDTEELPEDAADESARELEARVAANRIREIVGKEKVWDKSLGAYRPAMYGDIVILLRTIRGWADIFRKVLTDMDIPVYTGSRTGYFSTTEVQTVLSLLRIIDNPCQDIPLAAVLRSPIVGLTGEMLSQIRSSAPEATFYEACMQQEPLNGFFELLRELRDKASYTPIHELLWEIFDRTGYADYAASMPGGVQRRANLEMLVEKAVSYEAGSYHGLYNFIRYIENLHKYDVDFGEAGIGGGQEDVVRIYSIHKSKGLEFPIVFVSGMGKQMNQSDVRAGMIFNAELGIGIDHVDPVLRTKTATLLKRLLKRQTIHENLGEELRVLYVALTRAVEKLILTGAVSGAEEKLRRWGNVCMRSETVLPFTMRAHAATYWDWVMPALLRSKCSASILRDSDVVQDIRHPLYDREIFCRVRLIGGEALVAAETELRRQLLMTKEELLSLPQRTVFDEEAKRQITEHLAYRYPYEETAAIPSKVSVSELKKLAQYAESEDGGLLYEEPVPVPLIPEFLQGETAVSGAARGTVYHRFMECMEIGTLVSAQNRKDAVHRELDRQCARGYLRKEETALLDVEKICRFLENPLARRMAEASAHGRLFREQQFVLEVPADTVRPEWSGQETMLIQGIIDAFFVEDGRIVLLDYKTDFVKPQEASSLYDKYEVQLDYYRLALERLLKLPVAEKIIYSFCLDRTLQKRVEKE